MEISDLEIIKICYNSFTYATKMVYYTYINVIIYSPHEDWK